MTQSALHVGQDCGSNQSRESIGDKVTAEKYSIPLGEFTTSVPLGLDQQSSRQERSLDKTEKETNEDHASEVLDDSSQGRDHAPGEHGATDVVGGSGDAVDDGVGGDLHKNVSHVQNAQTGGILGVVEVKIGLQTLQTSRGDVVSVEVVHDVNGDKQGASSIQLAKHRFFDNLSSLWVHVTDMVEAKRLCLSLDVSRLDVFHVEGL